MTDKKVRKPNIRTLQPKLPLTPSRKKLFAALATAKKAQCMDEDTYRLLLAKHGATEDDKGKISASTMTDDQLSAALDDLNRKPRFYPKYQKSFKRRVFSAEELGDKKRKLLMIWTDLFNAGVLTECKTYEYAIWGGLDSWVKHYFDESGIAVESVSFMSEEQLDKAIYALQQWLERVLDKKDPERRKIRGGIKSRETAILENRETSCPRQSRTT